MEDLDQAYIEAYIRGELPEDKVAELEARMKVEPTVARAVQETRLLMELAQLSRRQAAQAQVEAARARYRAQSGHRPLRGRLLWAAAAAVLLLGAIGYLAWPRQHRLEVPSVVWQRWLRNVPGRSPILRTPTRAQYLFARAFHPKESLKSTTGGPEVEEAYLLYDAGRYDSALEAFRPLVQSDDSARFFMAQCHLALGMADSALAGMDDYLSRHDRTDGLAMEALWYRALALLRLDREADARAALQVIDPKGSHYEEAQSVMDLMK